MQDPIVWDRACASHDPSHRAPAWDVGCHRAVQVGLDVSKSVRGVLDLDNFATRIIKPLLKKASLPWYGWQAYRRGLASNLKALGIDDMVIQRVLRHSDVSTTQRSYIRVRDEKMHDAMLQLGLPFDACTAFVQPKDTPQGVN